MTDDSILVRGLWTPDGERGPTQIVVRAGRIAELRDAPTSSADSLSVLAVPAFANAHVHLDLSAVMGEDLRHERFADWVRDLVARRRGMESDEVRQSIQRGIEELIGHGVVAVGDIDSFGLSAPLLDASGLEGVAYREVLGRPDRESWVELDRWLADTGSSIRRGLSPHAPYSTPESVFAAVLDRASRGGYPWTSHVAETLEERDYLQRGNGAMARLFDEWGIPRSEWARPERGILERVLDLGVEHGTLVHVHHPEPRELERLLHSSRTVVFCRKVTSTSVTPCLIRS